MQFKLVQKFILFSIGKTRINGTQDYAVTADPYGDIFGTGVLNVKTNTGRIKIVKNDVDTNDNGEDYAVNRVEESTKQLSKKE